MLEHLRHFLLLGIAWLLPCCQGDHASNLVVDAGGAPNNGAIFTFDATFPVCREAGVPAAVDEGHGDGSTCQPTRHVSYTNDVVPIFGKNCSGEVCHSGAWAGSRAHLTLVDVPARECCDGRKLVRPGDPNASYVVQKLRGTDLCDGGKMPLGRTIDDRDIATIADWICEGAPGP
ncbi:MAG TPA: hypothetical protein VF395_12405 [Polyangiaceae bacterium]